MPRKKNNTELAAIAQAKLADGEKPTRDEAAALRRVKKDYEERTRWKYYAAIPQKHWMMMSGRQAKVINEQAERYGIPFGGSEVNLPDVVRSLHDFFARNARRLAGNDTGVDDPLLSGPETPAMEELRRVRIEIYKLELSQKQAKLADRGALREAFGLAATILRETGDRLQQEYGPKAFEIFTEGLDDAIRKLTEITQAQD